MNVCVHRGAYVCECVHAYCECVHMCGMYSWTHRHVYTHAWGAGPATMSMVSLSSSVCTCHFTRMLTGLTEPSCSLAVSPSHLSPWEKLAMLLNSPCQAPLSYLCVEHLSLRMPVPWDSWGPVLALFLILGVSHYRLKYLPAANYFEREFLTFTSK